MFKLRAFEISGQPLIKRDGQSLDYCLSKPEWFRNVQKDSLDNKLQMELDWIKYKLREKSDKLQI